MGSENGAGDGAKSGFLCRQCELQVKLRCTGENVACSGDNEMELPIQDLTGFEFLQAGKCPYMFFFRKI